MADKHTLNYSIGQIGPQPAKLTINGRGNDGRPRQNFADMIAALSVADYLTTADNYIWLSAFASNNLVCDYHWKADACYEEAQRRGDPGLYYRALRRAVHQPYEPPTD
jgi:hypothetical protein